jgi:hypothetical protein
MASEIFDRAFDGAAALGADQPLVAAYVALCLTTLSLDPMQHFRSLSV